VKQARTRDTFKLACTSSTLAIFLLATPAQASTGLVLFPDPIWLLIMLVAFTALVAPMNALIFRPIFRVLDERKERIDGARRRAAQLESEADEILRRYRASVQEVREEADRDRRSHLEAARSESSNTATAARGEAESLIERGRTDLDSWLTGARAGLRSSAEPLAQAAAERVLGRELH
jgi:F-type H+-transporting ATPase subunit b